ncbi:MAG: hypothetical protein R3E82_21515 [Pseudomonadales bacterium]
MTLRLWARVWSPVIPTELTHDAWRKLALPGEPDVLEPAFNSAFHHGAPTPTVSLLLHHSLNLAGDGTREEWMRVMAWLGLQYGDVRLPPDHLAVACEVMSVAVERSEDLICSGLAERYLLPWCQVAVERLDTAGNGLVELPRRFAQALDHITADVASP